ncbi:unnamed protein product [Spirodela intermedia]|uniref:Uncharacterized protein n=1 Tax=Spirodela intermedia TaxID=51605 RepID=A0A7I8K7D3_SPIIN|nr:unnamed protein product [Spirodela intermedia]
MRNSECIPRSISQGQNNLLCRIPNDEEIRSSFFSMKLHSAPNLDDLSVNFYTNYWDTMGSDLYIVIKNFSTVTPSLDLRRLPS